jgi:hypothetical protein
MGQTEQQRGTRESAGRLICIAFPLAPRAPRGRLFTNVCEGDLNFHDLVFFVFGEVGDLVHMLVGQFLHVVQPASLFVF